MSFSRSDLLKITVLTLVCFAAGALGVRTAHAQTACNDVQGTKCSSNAQCQATGDTSMICVYDGANQFPTCQPSCDDGKGVAQLNKCSMGETCVPLKATDAVDKRNVCRPAAFTMDLNLLDSCIYHFIEGTFPDNSSPNSCSLASNLSQMLEQDGTPGFSIYDVDLCIKKFLDDPGCGAGTCPNGQVYCTTNDQCGAGLFCNPDLNRCERECGLIVSRSKSDPASLDRKCAAPMAVCDYNHGKCHSLLDLTETCNVDADCGPDSHCIAQVCQRGGVPPALTCSVDPDCPTGAYCLVGQCVPRCYRSIECPDSNWYCSADNTCVPKPKDGSTGPAYNPKDYSISFAAGQVDLDPIESGARIPLVIMDVIKKRQVFDQPNVVLGYRLEVTYARKQDPKCLADLTNADCIVKDDEEFVTLDNPFGTIFGTGNPAISLRLNTGAADKLTTGNYQATLRAIFSNGTSTTTVIRFHKPSPSGDYTGRLTVGSGSIGDGGTEIPLATGNLALHLYVDPDKNHKVQWNTLLSQNNLASDSEFQDVTTGFAINGYIDVADSMMFSKPDATSEGNNRVPLKGIYADQLGRMHLIAVIDMKADYCRAESGACAGAKKDELQVGNPFGRQVRRVIEFIGPYDGTSLQFSGGYREKITGLAPYSITLNGGFQLSQIQQDETSVSLGALSDSTAAVGFPTLASILDGLQAEIDTNCKTTEGVVLAKRVSTGDAFSAYIKNFNASPSFRQLVTFESRAGAALGNLSAGQSLSLAQFFRGQIKFCPAGQTTDDPACISQPSLRCGEAAMRKALLAGWVDVGQIQRKSPKLFCPGVPGADDNCPDKGDKDPALVAIQEHNRFLREMTQTAVFQAGAELSDAFYVLFRAADKQPLEAADAYSDKDLNLRAALADYDIVRTDALSPAGTSVLFAIPAGRFAGMGDEWIAQLQTVFSDRMDALVSLVDLRRRVIQDGLIRQDVTFFKHLMQVEWLQQIYLATLQKHWQEASFAYDGKASALLAKGQLLINKASDTRNPLGLHQNRVYFENSDVTLNNWNNFRKSVETDLATLRGVADDVVKELKGSLSSRDSFMSKLEITEEQVQDTLNDLCGDDTPLPDACTVSVADRQLDLSCEGKDCPFPFECDGPECDQVVHVFKDATNTDSVACRSNTRMMTVPVDGHDRLCMRGKMGTLLQESVSLELTRKQTVAKVQSLLRQIAHQQDLIKETFKDDADLITYLENHWLAVQAVEVGIAAADRTFELSKEEAEAADCTVIAGTAEGGNCPQHEVASGLKVAATIAKYLVLPGLEEAKEGLEFSKEIHEEKEKQSEELAKMRRDLDDLVTSVENYVASYQTTTQQLFNLDIQIADTHFLALEAARRYKEGVGDLIMHLVGRESGNVLLANGMVQDFDGKFQHLLVETYKMSQAFLHRYNFLERSHDLQNRIYKLQTLDDVQHIVDDMKSWEHDYCASTGAECDQSNNRTLMRFSVRDELFPTLQDIIDPTTGKKLTKARQFHDLITSSAFVRRRFLSGKMYSQIELPFEIWLQDLGTVGGHPRPAMISELECNHIMASSPDGSSGTIAVSVNWELNKDVGKDVNYVLVRGDTDNVRSCDPVPAGKSERQINTWIAGSMRQDNAGTGSEPVFAIQSGGTACRNNTALDHKDTADSQTGCFTFFARDRSLAAPDWKFVIPDLDGAQKWILGEGLAEVNKPIISDIVLYFRHSKRQGDEP